MRIALVTRRFPPLIGGAETMLRYLATALADEGTEVTVLTSRIGDTPAEEWLDEAGASLTLPPCGGGQGGGSAPSTGPDVPPPSPSPTRGEGTREDFEGCVRVVRLATSPLRFVGTWLYMRNLRRWFARHPVDLAYVSMLKHDAFVATGMGRRLGFPVVLRPEGAGATGDIAWQGWGRGGRSIARQCKLADAFVAISAAVRADLIGAGYDAVKVVDLPNGVPVPEIAWSIRSGWERSPRATFVGRLAPEKGLHALIEAWPIVLRAFPEARLTLIGDGPERPGLESLVTRLGLAGHVELPGPSPNPGAILVESDLFVLPSREEGMSIALLEAMALGMPLVASSIPGNLKLVTGGIHGRLAPPDDPSGLARAIIAQWSDIDAAVGQGREARRRVIDDYSIAAVARAHLDLFRRLTKIQL
jgi:glycosyltransferase involved in cell wall biosynthesis